MDGSDHVSSPKMPMERRGSLNRENERLARSHAAELDGQDSDDMDWSRFP
jgi:hypothetical protein